MGIVLYIIFTFIFFYILFYTIRGALNDSELTRTMKEIKVLLENDPSRRPDAPVNGEGAAAGGSVEADGESHAAESCPACGHRTGPDDRSCPSCELALKD